ncbi:MAG: division/cell wall cluster transcriptional repressor MraZ [Flavobacteriales bacterium]|nr:division/cell wall cluster transcriptional repressor MraZ [Flavobacteriales bacterium]
MLNLIGEYDCKVDAKGRFMFPAALKKQIGEAFDKGFVVNRNLHQKCLVLYTLDEWQKLNKGLSKLNRLLPKNDMLVRKIIGGATGAEADNTGRVLVPRSLADYAGIQTEIKVLGSNNVVEIWDKAAYEAFMSQEINLEELAEDVLGNLNFTDNDE